MSEVETQSPVEKALEEHRELRTLLAELLEFLERERPEVSAEDAPAWAADLTKQLVHLHRQVYRHFRAEETSGVLDTLSESFPHAERAIEALSNDHDRILSDFRAVIQSAMCYTEGKVEGDQNLRQWTRSIVEHIQQHESEETELMQSLVIEDLGVGD